MKNVLHCVIAVLLASLAVQASADAADSVFYNGRVYTVDDSQPWAQALARPAPHWTPLQQRARRIQALQCGMNWDTRIS